MQPARENFLERYPKYSFYHFVFCRPLVGRFSHLTLPAPVLLGFVGGTNTPVGHAGRSEAYANGPSVQRKNAIDKSLTLCEHYSERHVQREVPYQHARDDNNASSGLISEPIFSDTREARTTKMAWESIVKVYFRWRVVRGVPSAHCRENELEHRLCRPLLIASSRFVVTTLNTPSIIF